MKHFLLFFSLLLLFACSDSTSPKSLTLSGQVSILDYDGNPASESLEEITVMLYNTIKIDPDLLKVKSDYPFIGAEITQEVFFDIRDAEPIRTVNCNSQGEYTLTLNKGDYNIVFYKEGYGYNIKHEVEVNNDLTLGEVVLNQVVSLSGSLSNFTFESGKLYHITDDLIIPANSNVVFETGANIDVANNKKIFLMSDLNVTEIAKEDYVKFNSIYNNLGTKSIFRGIEFIGMDNLQIEHIMIKNATTGIGLLNLEIAVNINNCVLNNNDIGVSVQNSDSLSILNCNIFNNSITGIDLSTESTSNNNIIYSNYEGIRILEADCKSYNNYFLSNYIGLRLAYFNHMDIHNNEFDLNEYGISMSGANPIVENNKFYDDDVNIALCRRYVQDYDELCYPVIKNNNFIGKHYSIDVKGKHSISSTWAPVWGIRSSGIICNANFWNNNKNMIKDGVFYGENGKYIVIIETEKFNIIPNCGIVQNIN